jgi:uncharacterized oxidoreductase
VAQGKVRVAHNKGEKVSPEWLIDERGNPTAEPRYGVLEPFGALRTFGLHKGYGLALACELLGGALTGGGTQHMPDQGKMRVLNGMLSILIDPAALGTAQTLAEQAEAFIAWEKASPAAAGVERVLIAGDPERAKRRERLAAGIAVDMTTWEEILAAGEMLKLPRAEVQRLAGLG